MSDKLLKELNPNGITITKEQAEVVKAILSYHITWAVFEMPRVDDAVYEIQNTLDEITEEVKP